MIMIIILLYLINYAVAWNVSKELVLGRGPDFAISGTVINGEYTELVVWTRSGAIVGNWLNHKKEYPLNVQTSNEFVIATSASGLKLTKLRGKNSHRALLTFINNNNQLLNIIRCDLQTKTIGSPILTNVSETDINRIVLSDSVGENLLSISTVLGSKKSVIITPLLPYSANESYYEGETIVLNGTDDIWQPSAALFLDDSLIISHVIQNDNITTIIGTIYTYKNGILTEEVSLTISEEQSENLPIDVAISSEPNGGFSVVWRRGMRQYSKTGHLQYDKVQQKTLPCGSGTLKVFIDQSNGSPTLVWEDPSKRNTVVAMKNGETMQFLGANLQLIFLSEGFYGVSWMYEVGDIGVKYLIDPESNWNTQELISTQVRDTSGSVVVSQGWTGSSAAVTWQDGEGDTFVHVDKDIQLSSKSFGNPAICGSDGFIVFTDSNESNPSSWYGNNTDTVTIVSTATINQTSPSCSAVGSDAYIAVWEDVASQTLLFRIYNPSDDFYYTPIAFGKTHSSQPSVTVLSSGHYFIVWTEDNTVVGSEFDTSGKQLSKNTISPKGGHNGKVSAFGGGEKIIAWTDEYGDITYKVFDSNDKMLSEKYVGHFNELRLIVLGDDTFIISHHHQVGGMSTTDVRDYSQDILTITRRSISGNVSESITLEGADGGSVISDNGILYVSYVNRSVIPAVYRSTLQFSLGPVVPFTYSPSVWSHTNTPTGIPPTVAPTVVPTVVPTVAPTVTPTVAPTATPTVIQTSVPSPTGNTSSTGLPTSTPTDVETRSPTSSPTTLYIPDSGSDNILLIALVTVGMSMCCLSLLVFSVRRYKRRNEDLEEVRSPLMVGQTVEMQQTIEIHIENLRKEGGSTSNDMTLPEASTGRELNTKDIDWVPIKLLGTGTYGTVSLGVIEPGGSLMAVKTIPQTSDSETLEKLRGEIDRMTRLSHPNVIKYLGERFDSLQSKMHIFMEYIEGGSLHEMAVVKYLSEQTVARLAKQALHGLEYIHKEGVIHRDIKGANILVGNHGRVVLADFGCSRDSDTSWKSGTVAGTPSFMSPELVLSEGIPKYTPSIDIWAFGCTIVEILNKGRPPWPTFDTPWAAFFHMANVFRAGGLPTQIPDNLSPECRAFVCSTFKPNNERPTATELLGDPFLHLFDADEESQQPLLILE